MTSEPWNQVVDELRSLIRLGRQLALRYGEAYEGLQSATMGILALLVRHGGLRLTTVAERQFIDTSVASRQVTELVERGLVERVPDPQDARANLLVATEQGRVLASRARQRQRHLAEQALAAWSDTELRSLAENLARLNGDLRARFGNPPDPLSTDTVGSG